MCRSWYRLGKTETSRWGSYIRVMVRKAVPSIVRPFRTTPPQPTVEGAIALSAPK
ncbi:hypothetical protein IG631_03393 [Alternaria alternata]|nr:hypothetical protein IG631_03393 [Alternaria alternata]